MDLNNNNPNHLSHLQQIHAELRKLLQEERKKGEAATFKAVALYTNNLSHQLENEMQPHSASGAVVTKAGHLLFYTIL